METPSPVESPSPVETVSDPPSRAVMDPTPRETVMLGRGVRRAVGEEERSVEIQPHIHHHRRAVVIPMLAPMVMDVRERRETRMEQPLQLQEVLPLASQ